MSPFTSSARTAERRPVDERQAIRFGRRDLRAALRRLSPEDLVEALRFRYLPIAW
jgi:hypothetical protein